MCMAWSNYRREGRVGEGAFSTVYSATHLPTGETHALKVLRAGVVLPSSSSSLSAGESSSAAPPERLFREVQALRRAEPHPNLLRLHAAFPHGANLVLATEFCPWSLADVLRPLPQSDCGLSASPPARVAWPETAVKGVLLQLLRGVEALHSRARVLHRDLKPSNVLVSPEGVIKVADLGLARPFVGGEEGGEEEEGRKYTHVVATRWYRAPELLFGSRQYGPAVDLWAVGCIFGELLTWAPLFPGDNDIDQLCRVRRALGSPTEDVWPGVSRLPDFGKVVFADDDNSTTNSGGTLRTEIVPRGEVRDKAAEFLEKFLRYDPSKRITAAKALEDPYFTSEPLPLPALDLLKLLQIAPSSHQVARKPHDELMCHLTTRHDDVLAAFSMPQIPPLIPNHYAQRLHA